jgi:hypothetical protein
MDNQIDLYKGVHKGQRVRFFTISKEAGAIDFTDQKAKDRLQEELESFREHMRLHAALEEKFIHPLLSERVPRGSRKLEEDHRIMHQQLDDHRLTLREQKQTPRILRNSRNLSWSSIERGTGLQLSILCTLITKRSMCSLLCGNSALARNLRKPSR